MEYKDEDFEKSLQETLALYVAPPDVSGRDIFQVHREIAIARLALNNQARAYAKSIEVLFQILDKIVNSPIADEGKAITNIMSAINMIEVKSANLIKSVKDVTELLGNAINIDVDKAHLRTMLINLPSLVKKSITTLTNDDQLADKIFCNLNSQITDMMVAFRFSDGSNGVPLLEDDKGITLQQLNEMVNSVPTASYQ